VTTVTDAQPWVSALRSSHDRLSGTVAGLDSDGLQAQSYDTEWSIADVLSHLGSGAEIFLLTVNAGASGDAPPAREQFQEIWDRWNAKAPDEQAADSVAANEALVSRVEALTPAERESFSVTMFGPRPMDLAGVLNMRLGEHAIHSWDVAVALDPAAQVAPYAVALLIDTLVPMAGYFGKKSDNPMVIAVTTTDPERAFTIDTGTTEGGGVSVTPGAPGDAATASLEMPAEVFLRLLTGRVDDASELTASGVTLPELKAVFPGF
jgi:uncharacterized protein (TIGR03083 family)